jgi:hypothetical protein
MTASQPWLEIGRPTSGPPEPHDPQRTTLIQSHGVIVGVEHRRVGSDGGVALHVFATDMTELLRFDCFTEEPHYHYIFPDRPQRVVAFDVAAHGDMIDWILGTVLPNRLASMLAVVGNITALPTGGLRPDTVTAVREAVGTDG